jgi:hypothetical protein
VAEFDCVGSDLFLVNFNNSFQGFDQFIVIDVVYQLQVNSYDLT